MKNIIWSFRSIPGEIFIGLFIVAYFLYSFSAFRNSFEQKWESVALGDLKGSAIEILGLQYSEKSYLLGQTLEIETLAEVIQSELSYLVWEIGIKNYYVLGIDNNQIVALKAKTETLRVNAGS